MSIESEWEDNKKKAEKILRAIKKALKSPDDLAYLPCDMDNPQTQTEVDAVNPFAQHCYDLSCELTGVFEAMMVGDQVQKKLNDIQLEMEGPRDMYQETGMKRSDF